jgi:hypothetical protein
MDMETILIIGGILTVMVLVFLGMSMATARRSARTPLDKQFIGREWQKITALAEHSDQSARYAVIEADKLLDYVLKARGYRGEKMGDRLREAGPDFSYQDDVWQAHKLRNKLVHEAEYEVDHRLISRAIKQFRQALKDMGAF